MLAAQRPDSQTPADERPALIRSHLRGFAVVLPPCLIGMAFVLTVPPMMPSLYIGGFLFATALAVIFGVWLSDRTARWYDATHTDED